jgi:hypothetical protein
MAEETEFESDGHQYRIRKLSAMQQFHLSRKIAPLIPPLIPVFMEMRDSVEGGDNVDKLSLLLQPFADGLAGMSDAAAESILNTCMSALKRRAEVGDLFVPVWGSGNVPMFADLNDIGKCIPLAVRVVQDNLGPFIAGLLTARQTTG